jgi:Mg2+ and Co2+ transporter CorA
MFAKDAAEGAFRAGIVSLILAGRTEDALHSLSTHYGVEEPSLRVGTVKGHRYVLACYVNKKRRIYVSRSELLTNPFVILHEFYHHIRASQIQKRRQVEKRADWFAFAFIREFNQNRSRG